MVFICLWVDISNIFKLYVCNLELYIILVNHKSIEILYLILILYIRNLNPKSKNQWFLLKKIAILPILIACVC